MVKMVGKWIGLQIHNLKLVIRIYKRLYTRSKFLPGRTACESTFFVFRTGSRNRAERYVSPNITTINRQDQEEVYRDMSLDDIFEEAQKHWESFEVRTRWQTILII